MKNIYKAIALALAITGVSGTATTFAAVNDNGVIAESRAAAVQSGWQYNGHVWRYWQNGQVATGWVKDAGKWYYLSLDDGAMVTYPTEINGSVYVFRADGSLVEKGWTYTLNQWYFVNKDTNTAARYELKVVDGIRYYFDNNGVMQVGPTWAEGQYSLFTESGARVENGWSNFRGTWYYSGHGQILTNRWLWNGGNYYYLNQDGKMLTNTIVDGYLLSASGAMVNSGWYKVGNDWYSVKGSNNTVRYNEWYKEGNTWYYLKSDGKMACNEALLIDGSWYFFNSTGAMR